MKTIFVRGILSLGILLAVWFGLSRISWTGLFQIRETRDTLKEDLSKILWQMIEKNGPAFDDPYVTQAVDSIIRHVCQANHIDPETVKAHILSESEVNAFALPQGHIIIHTGLIKAADSQDELTGVICHELAHIRLNHVMHKLTREVGLSILISMTTGQGGGELIRQTAKTLSSTAFDRKMEKEADIKAVEYLINAGANPEDFAAFLYRLADQEPEFMGYLGWISTHPDSKERAGYIIGHSQQKQAEYKEIISGETWNELKRILENQSDKLQ